MPESTIKPLEIELDKVTNGDARLLCHWNYSKIERDGTIFYMYEEKVIHWALPHTFVSNNNIITIETRQDVELFISLNSEEIMNFARGAKKNIK